MEQLPVVKHATIEEARADYVRFLDDLCLANDLLALEVEIGEMEAMIQECQEHIDTEEDADEDADGTMVVQAAE